MLLAACHRLNTVRSTNKLKIVVPINNTITMLCSLLDCVSSHGRMNIMLTMQHKQKTSTQPSDICEHAAKEQVCSRSHTNCRSKCTRYGSWHSSHLAHDQRAHV